jgi:RNA polymerase sigma-70 factor (ECF subfamily)
MHEWSRDGRPNAAASGAEETAGLSAREPLTQTESEIAAELFARHRLSLYRYLNGLLHSREEAKDVLQETYLRLLRQPSLDHVRDNARAYLFKTATNLARDLFRQRSVRGVDAEFRAYSASGLHTPDWNSWPELALQGDQVAAIVIEALQELDSRVREALLLHRYRDMSRQSIGLRMGLSTRTVERYIKDGLTHIGRRLKAEI